MIKQVQFSDWAAPIVPVTKADGTIRICGDYKVTVNTVSKLDHYPLPKVNDLFTAMSGGKLFTKLDLSTCLPTATVIRRFQEVHHHQYFQRIVSV